MSVHVDPQLELVDLSPAAHFTDERAQAQGKDASVQDHTVNEQRARAPISLLPAIPPSWHFPLGPAEFSAWGLSPSAVREALTWMHFISGE